MANTVRAATVQRDWTCGDVDPMITEVRDRDLDMAEDLVVL
jgi:hypothetical protein